MNPANGIRVTFDTHWNDTRLNARSGQTVTVLRPLTVDEADLYDVGPMFRVRFDDGTVEDVFDDELSQ